MTSAHRPTWNAAVASGSNPSGGCFVAADDEGREQGRGELHEAEDPAGRPGPRGGALEAKERKAAAERDGKSKPKAPQLAIDNPFPEDADEDVPDKSEASGNEGSDDEDEDEDTEELMRELAKIKQEREAEEAAAKAQREKQDERARREEVFKGNPLLEATGDLSLKRKWDDDTVFKNQARTAPKQKQRYINDAVRSDFHKKFLNKYVWMDGLAH
eukprot:CAMPEP_0176080208 /NCGR_PEP_ID=MMETSP0120_2-20121206/40119_1 /TAXON_ID=160619 /ORGANISM="Kryptoperidinium foliaceum, Strain CCMP 1326" /LENGTH=214 /DNA_ID=CAMNT_0017413971 /DNA_START=17 /DNA_END=660 /DNA_ORIENTATION=+